MNRIYNVKFNKKTGLRQVVGETVKLNGKGANSTKKFVAAMLTVFTMTGVKVAQALPTGGQVANGSAVISSSGSQMNINQASQNATINWTNFNVASGEKVQYTTPSATSITLNRISGSVNTIAGAVVSNGNLWFSNPNGSLSVVAGGKVVSTGGEVYMTTQDIKAGQYVKPTATAQAGSINLSGKAQIFASNIVIDASSVNMDDVKLVARERDITVTGGQISIANAIMLAKKGSIALGNQDTVSLNIYPIPSLLRKMYPQQQIN